MPTREEYYEALTEMIAQRISSTAVKVEYARVVAFADNGKPLLVFQGETTASQKTYPRLRSYNDPRIGDRVQLIDGIIQGARA